MAQPFVVVDLAPGARDFQPVALEPGRPMLDRLKANYQVLRAWLGEYAAEPEPAGGDVVGFLIPARVRAGAEAGGVAHRPVVDACVPATPRDLAGPLRKQLDELRRLIQQATPKSETERALHRVLLRARDAQLDPGAEHPGCILFKYRDPAGTWRLVWCWGYRRRDEGLGEPVVHDGRLYFRRPGERLADLVGSGAVVDVDEDAPRSRRRRRLRVAGILSSVLLLAIGGTVGWLAANPGNWKRVKDWIVPPPPAPIILDGSTSARPDNNKGTSPVPRPSDSESSTEPPFTLAITAEGPEVIPVGQTVLLRAWKDYGDDRRELLADAPEWKADEEVAGLTLQPDGMVEATQPGAGPLKIRAVYRGKRSDETKESNELQFRGGPAVPVTLAITAPRPTLLVGESGQLTLSATDEQGLPVDLAEGRAEFALAPGAGAGILDLTSDGGYRALGAGPVTVTASHPAAQQSARRELSVVRPDQVQLVFRPERVTVAAGASTELRLLLNPVRGGATPVALGDAAVVDIKNGHPEAVRWESPDLVGIQAVAGTFPLEATYQGLKATAQVQVVAPDAATALRIRRTEAGLPPDQPPTQAPVPGPAGAAAPSGAARVAGPPQAQPKAAVTASVPSLGTQPASGPPAAKAAAAAAAEPPTEATLAPGQPITLTVEQQVGGMWQEVQPDLVAWGKPPEGVDWTPPAEGLRPIVALREGTGTVTLTAEYPPKGEGQDGSKSASFTLRPMSEQQLKALREETERLLKDPKSRVVMTPQRPVPSRRAGVRRSTRYTPMIRGNGRFAPLVGGVWPSSWNGPYWGWNGPVLTTRGSYYPWEFPYGYGGRTYRGLVNPSGRRGGTSVRRKSPPPPGPAPVITERPESPMAERVRGRLERITITQRQIYQDEGRYTVDLQIQGPYPAYRIVGPGSGPEEGWMPTNHGMVELTSPKLPLSDHELEIEARNQSGNVQRFPFPLDVSLQFVVKPRNQGAAPATGTNPGR